MNQLFDITYAHGQAQTVATLCSKKTGMVAATFHGENRKAVELQVNLYQNATDARHAAKSLQEELDTARRTVADLEAVNQDLVAQVEELSDMVQIAKNKQETKVAGGQGKTDPKNN